MCACWGAPAPLRHRSGTALAPPLPPCTHPPIGLQAVGGRMLQAITNVLQGLDPESLAEESAEFLDELQQVLFQLSCQKKPGADAAVEVRQPL